MTSQLTMLLREVRTYEATSIVSTCTASAFTILVVVADKTFGSSTSIVFEMVPSMSVVEVALLPARVQGFCSRPRVLPGIVFGQF